MTDLNNELRPWGMLAMIRSTRQLSPPRILSPVQRHCHLESFTLSTHGGFFSHSHSDLKSLEANGFEKNLLIGLYLSGMILKVISYIFAVLILIFIFLSEKFINLTLTGGFGRIVGLAARPPNPRPAEASTPWKKKEKKKGLFFFLGDFSSFWVTSYQASFTSGQSCRACLVPLEPSDRESILPCLGIPHWPTGTLPPTPRQRCKSSSMEASCRHCVLHYL